MYEGAKGQATVSKSSSGAAALGASGSFDGDGLDGDGLPVVDLVKLGEVRLPGERRCADGTLLGGMRVGVARFVLATRSAASRGSLAPKESLAGD